MSKSITENECKKVEKTHHSGRSTKEECLYSPKRIKSFGEVNDHDEREKTHQFHSSESEHRRIVQAEFGTSKLQ